MRIRETAALGLAMALCLLAAGGWSEDLRSERRRAARKTEQPGPKPQPTQTSPEPQPYPFPMEGAKNKFEGQDARMPTPEDLRGIWMLVARVDTRDFKQGQYKPSGLSNGFLGFSVTKQPFAETGFVLAGKMENFEDADPAPFYVKASSESQTFTLTRYARRTRKYTPTGIYWDTEWTRVHAPHEYECRIIGDSHLLCHWERKGEWVEIPNYNSPGVRPEGPGEGYDGFARIVPNIVKKQVEPRF